MWRNAVDLNILRFFWEQNQYTGDELSRLSPSVCRGMRRFIAVESNPVIKRWSNSLRSVPRDSGSISTIDHRESISNRMVIECPGHSPLENRAAPTDWPSAVASSVGNQNLLLSHWLRLTVLSTIDSCSSISSCRAGIVLAISDARSRSLDS